MPRRPPNFALALAGVSALLFVAQCGGSTIPEAAAVTSGVTGAMPTTTSTTESAESYESMTTPAPMTTPDPTTAPDPTTTTTPEPTTTTTPPPVIDPNCPLTPHAAVIDRDPQRAWLCDNGVAMPEFVVTTAREQPDPGTYPVFAKSMHASSRLGGHYSTMTHFVAFTRGEETGARVGFHTVPVLGNGQHVQPLESVGAADRRGDTSGCIRVLPDQGQVVWDWLQVGDEVHVIN